MEIGHAMNKTTEQIHTWLKFEEETRDGFKQRHRKKIGNSPSTTLSVYNHIFNTSEKIRR